jgi:hypothetical protein
MEIFEMQHKDDVYEAVPAHGQMLSDGTWWTNSSARVGEVCTNHHYHRKYNKTNKQWYSKPKVSKCVESGVFGGRKFARWESVDTEWKEAILCSNNSMDYK